MTVEHCMSTFKTRRRRDDAFSEIYRSYHSSIRSFFGRSGFAAEDCRDLTQETFLRVWRGITTFRGDSKIGSWLYTIAANVGRNEFSRRKSLKRDGESVPFDDAADTQLSDGIDSALSSIVEPLEVLLTKEEATILRREIEKLPPRMLRILLLRLDQGLKLREIAVLEQISINTVKSQLGQAKSRLRLYLASYLGKSDSTRIEELSQ